MTSHCLLTADEERDLLLRARRGDAGALESLVAHNQRLVFSVANRYYHGGYGGDQEIDDLAQWGNLGMIQAIRKWDPNRGVRFSTYAIHWIEAYIRRYGAARGLAVSMTHRDVGRLSKIRKARAVLTSALKRSPTPAEIAAECGLSTLDVAAWLPALSGEVRLDGEAFDDGGIYHELVGSPDAGPERELERKELASALQRMDARYREVITRRFFNNPSESRAEIAQSLGVSVECVRKLEQQALEILRPLID